MSQFAKSEHEPDLEVELTLFSTEEGGRKLPIEQGWRCPHDFGLPGEMNDGTYVFAGEPLKPGERRRAFIYLSVPERNRGRLNVGFEFRIWEGQFIGSGNVIRVINPILLQCELGRKAE